MKIAIPYDHGEVFQHFGHTEQFRIYTVENDKVTEAKMLLADGIGHEDLAELLREQGVSLVICGGIGAGAEQALTDAGLVLCSGVSGMADEVADAYVAGTLEYGQGANCDHHHDHEEGGSCGGGCGGCHGGCHGCADDYVETRTFTEIVHLTHENFEAEVLQDPGLICIDFWATWCGPCKMMAPVFEEVNGEQPKVKFCKVDVDEQPELAQLFGIESIPTIVLVQNRRTLTGFVGAQGKDTLTTMIEGYLR